MDIDAVMKELADRANTIDGLRGYHWPADSVEVPCLAVDYPEIAFDATMGRGSDRYSVPMYLLVARTSDRTAPKRLAPFLRGAGPQSIKAVLEADPEAYQSFHGTSLCITDGEHTPMRIGDVDYEAYTLTADLTGPGDT